MFYTGSGIAAPDLEVMYRCFYSSDSSLARSTGGSGLGLTIAKQLVEAHGGIIGVESTVNEGSRFFFELPLNHPNRQL